MTKIIYIFEQSSYETKINSRTHALQHSELFSFDGYQVSLSAGIIPITYLTVHSDISFPLPSFAIFKHISERYSDHRSHIQLVKNLLYQYRQRLLAGLILTVIASSINLYLSLLIQDFIDVMQEGETSRTSN